MKDPAMTQDLNALDPIDPLDPVTVFPWPQAGGAWRADPITGALTRVTSPDPEPTDPAQE